MVKKLCYATTFLFLLNVFWAKAQPVRLAEIGKPFVRNFSPKEYGAFPQNWAIAQDARGMVYVGNNFGLLQFDGVSWRLLPVPNGTVVRSLLIDRHNRLWIGAKDEVGLLKATPQGKLQYSSLLAEIPVEKRNFGSIWAIYEQDSAIYFCGSEQLLRYDGRKLHTIPLPQGSDQQTNFHRVFQADTKLYALVYSEQTGQTVYYEVIGNQLLALKAEVPLPRAFGLFDLGQGRLLSGSRSDQPLSIISRANDQLYVEPLAGSPFKGDDLLYSSARLGEDLLGFGTINAGVFVTDTKGSLQYRLNKQLGLADDLIIGMKADRQNGLWVATNNGISRALLRYPLSRWDESDGLRGGVNASVRFRDQLYVGTDLGVFVLDDGAFRPLPGIEDQVWDLTVFDHPSFKNGSKLFISTSNGVYLLGEGLRRVSDGSAFKCIVSPHHPDMVYIAGADGLSGFRLLPDGRLGRKSEWIPGADNYLLRTESEIRSITFDSQKRLWICTAHHGAYALHFDSEAPNPFTPTKIQHWGEGRGLPLLKDLYVYHVAGKLLFGTPKGLYELDEQESMFRPSRQLGERWVAKDVFLVVPDTRDRIWMVGAFTEHSPLGWVTAPGQVWEDRVFRLLPTTAVQHLYHEDDGVSWISTADGLFRFDARMEARYDHAFEAMIREVKVSDDTVLFGGDFAASFGPDTMQVSLTRQQPVALIPVLDYVQNDLVFQVSGTWMDGTAVWYSYWLEGDEQDWSNWTQNTIKEYTNLYEGTYTFHVKARNLYGTETQAASYTFVIRPPWYRTWWALTAYSLLAVGLVYQLIRYQSRRLSLENARLEDMVQTRTAEIRLQNTRIEEQHQEIARQHEDIRAGIAYAQSIQKAILPTESEMNKHFAGHSVFWQPLGIVSGDFYWLRHIIVEGGRHCTLLAVGDCTGHGVPGAIMSMLGNDLLNQAVDLRHLWQPADILAALNLGIRQTLHQDLNTNMDGMDMAVCAFFQPAPGQPYTTMLFAGAMSSVIITHARQPLRWLKGNRRPLGGNIRGQVHHEPFAQYEEQLNGQETICLFTDGYTDQFGGPANKKISTGGFRSLLESIADLPVSEQGARIRQYFFQWKGAEEQVDDVLVVCIRNGESVGG